MSTQLHLAYGIVDGKAWSVQDRALLRTVELERREARQVRRARRSERILGRRTSR